MSARRPLSAIRVVDFGQLTAGANTSAMLADLGADVIKIESPANLDLFRIIGAVDQAPGWWNRSPPFRFSNRNKRSIALDLKSEDGRRLARGLIAQSDVVVENFRRGVLERLGLDFEALRAESPKIILASVSSQGETGPNRLHASFGSTLDATGGLAAMTGYPDDAPLVSGSDVNYPDQVVSLISVGLILAALREVRRTGLGVRLDISQREVVSFLIGEEIVAAGAQGARRAVRRGNADGNALLQDCFACADGRWVAVTVSDEAQAQRALALIGPGISPGGTGTALAEPGTSLAEPGTPLRDSGPAWLRSSLAAWCGRQHADEAAAALAGTGIAAAPVLNGVDLLHAPHLSGGSLAIDASGALVKGMPYAFDAWPFAVRRDAPDLGQDTDDVLREVLGLPEDDIERLKALGVTRTDP